MRHEVTVIKGRRFPTCRHCDGISFQLAHAAKYVGEIDHLEEAHAPAQSSTTSPGMYPNRRVLIRNNPATALPPRPVCPSRIKSARNGTRAKVAASPPSELRTALNAQRRARGWQHQE